MKPLFVLLILLLAAPVGLAQTTTKKTRDVAVEQQLLKLNKEYDDALVRGDASALEEIFADEFVYTSTSGEVVNRAQQLELIKSKSLKIDSGASDEVQVRLYGNMAIVLGRFKSKGQFNGQPFDSIERYTSVWMRRGGKWHLVAEQGTLVPKR